MAYCHRVIILFLFIVSLPSKAAETIVTPWGPFQSITIIVQDLNDIRHAKNTTTPIQVSPPDPQKTPTDVYHKTYLLLEKIQELANKQDFTIDTPITLPTKRTGRIIPSEVLEVMQQIQQATSEIRRNLGVKKQQIETPLEPGQTPPDVYRKVEKALGLVDSLL